MTTCPCGCDRPVKGGNRYATSGCAGRVLFRSLDPAQSRIWHQQARAVGIQVQRGRVLEQLRGLSFEAAVSRAYWLGYRAAHTARRRGTAA